MLSEVARSSSQLSTEIPALVTWILSDTNWGDYFHHLLINNFPPEAHVHLYIRHASSPSWTLSID